MTQGFFGNDNGSQADAQSKSVGEHMSGIAYQCDGSRHKSSHQLCHHDHRSNGHGEYQFLLFGAAVFEQTL